MITATAIRAYIERQYERLLLAGIDDIASMWDIGYSQGGIPPTKRVF